MLYVRLIETCFNCLKFQQPYHSENDFRVLGVEWRMYGREFRYPDMDSICVTAKRIPRTQHAAQ